MESCCTCLKFHKRESSGNHEESEELDYDGLVKKGWKVRNIEIMGNRMQVQIIKKNNTGEVDSKNKDGSSIKIEKEESEKYVRLSWVMTTFRKIRYHKGKKVNDDPNRMLGWRR